jgi:hypothetical protein
VYEEIMMTKKEIIKRIKNDLLLTPDYNLLEYNSEWYALAKQTSTGHQSYTGIDELVIKIKVRKF